MGLRSRASVLALVVCAVATASSAWAQRELTVSAAASLTDVLNELVRRYEAKHGVRVRVNAAASNTLARQLVEGAPVDVFISADAAQMAVVAKAGRLVAGSEVPLLTNALVVAVPRGAHARVRQPQDLASPAIRRIAMGQPEIVPAGVYGRRWLESLGLWSVLQPKVVPMPTVRAAIAAVREERVDAAIVYATDARLMAEVDVDYRVSPKDGPAISYPVAVIAGRMQDEAARFVAYLRSSEARAVFEAAGFGVAASR